MEVNYKIPVSLFDYRESENPLYSFAKLKIFYIGRTPDRRLFTKKFSDQLLRTLPYVPVVGYYSDERDDFVGHNSKVQHIYGIVPEDAKIEYVKEDGKEYAVCDVILYTGRNDDTGKIAQKIIGKSHSLELNPGDTTYQINHSIDGRLESIEFLTGSLLGLSVLGDDEQPAFTGSEFFKEFKEIFSEDILNSLNDVYKNTQCSFTSKKSFARDSYENRKKRAYNALKEMYPNVKYEILEMTDGFIVYCEYIYDQNGEYKVHYRIDYTDNGKVVRLIGGPEEVHAVYLTDEEVDIMSEPANQLDYKTLQDLDLKPTETMANNAKRGLDLRKEHGRGGTAVGVARARDLMNRKNLSPQTVGRMFSFFSRHEVDKKAQGWKVDEEGYPSNGLIAWLLWGGDAGFSWSRSKWNQIQKIRDNASLEHSNVEVNILEEKDLLQEQELEASVVSEIVEETSETPSETENMQYPKDKDKDYVEEEITEEEEEEEVTVMAWSCDGMEHENCEKQEDGSWICDGMEHPNCIKVEDMQKNEEDTEKEEMGLKGTENNEEEFSKEAEETEVGDQIEKNTTKTETVEEEKQENLNSSALADGEREELIALREEVYGYRKSKKLGLIDSFKEDLSKSFIDGLVSKIDEFSYDQLEVQLSKEFTRITKEQKTQSSKFKPLSYSGQNNTPTSENKTDVVKRLVEQLK